MMEKRPSKFVLRLIFFIMLMDVIGLTILIPVTPYIIKRYSDDALMVTMTTALYAAAQFFAAPLLGKLGDRHGRRPVLLISVFGSAVGYVLFGIGGALWILFLSRLMDGFTGGNMSTASAYIADVSAPEERAQNFSLIGIAWGIGLILGPALGSVTAQISLDAPAFTAAGLSLLSVVLGYFWLPESLAKDQRETRRIRLQDINPFAAIGEMARKPGIGGLLVVLGLFNFGFNGINSIQSLFVIDKFEAEPFEVGVLLVLIGISVIFVQAFLVRRIVPLYGEKPIAIMSLLGLGFSVAVIYFIPTLWLIFPLAMLSNGISGFTFPTLTTLTANGVSAREQGVLMGVITALNSMMNILGSLWAGTVYDRVAQGAPYWMGGMIFVFAAYLLLRLSVGELEAEAA